MAFTYVDCSGAQLKIASGLVDFNQVINTNLTFETPDVQELIHYGCYPNYDVVAKRIKVTGSCSYYKNPSGGTGYTPIVPTGANVLLEVNQPRGIYFSGSVLITKSTMDLTVENDANKVDFDFQVAGGYALLSGKSGI